MSVCAELSDAGWSESDTEWRVTEAGDSGPSSSDRLSPLITAAGSPVRNQTIFLQDQGCFLGLAVRDCDSYIMLTCVPSNQLKWVALSLFQCADQVGGWQHSSSSAQRDWLDRVGDSKLQTLTVVNVQTTTLNISTHSTHIWPMPVLKRYYAKKRKCCKCSWQLNMK